MSRQLVVPSSNHVKPMPLRCLVPSFYGAALLAATGDICAHEEQLEVFILLL